MNSEATRDRIGHDIDCSDYRTPGAHSRLERRGSSLQTPDGGTAYKIVEGIPRFLRFKPVESVQERAMLTRLNEVAIGDGWRKALADVYGEGSGMYRYVTDPVRLGFLDLVPLNDRSVVLEVGSGLGQMTSELASRAGMVHGLEVVPGQARFVLERCRQNGHDNVAMACGGDDCFLPYRDGLFDVVVINLVLEWCGARLEDEAFEDAQRRLISEAYRVLKPGGRLFVATKNRYALRYVLGKPDEHSYQMRFGNALPRWLHKMWLRSKGHRRPVGLLHSHNALARILTDTGFFRHQSYWAAPEMRYGRDFVPTDAKSIREARRRPTFVQGESRITRLLMRLVPAPLVRHVTPGLLFVSEKPAGG